MVTPVLLIVLAPQVAPALQVAQARQVAPALQVVQIRRATLYPQTIPVRQVLEPRPIHHHNLALTAPKRRKRKMCLTHLTMCMGSFAWKNLLKPTSH